MFSCVGIWVLGNKPVPTSYSKHNLYALFKGDWCYGIDNSIPTFSILHCIRAKDSLKFHPSPSSPFLISSSLDPHQQQTGKKTATPATARCSSGDCPNRHLVQQLWLLPATPKNNNRAADLNRSTCCSIQCLVLVLSHWSGIISTLKTRPRVFDALSISITAKLGFADSTQDQI